MVWNQWFIPCESTVSGWCFIWTGTGLYVRKRITQVWITGFRTCRAHHGHHMTFMFNLPIFCLWQKVHGAPHSFHESVPTVIYSQFFWCWISINMKKTILSGYSTTWFQSRKKVIEKVHFLISSATCHVRPIKCFPTFRDGQDSLRWTCHWVTGPLSIALSGVFFCDLGHGTQLLENMGILLWWKQ
jgi:hypothetical protein